MTLTGQVFQLLFGIASDRQAEKIVRSVKKYLYDPTLHGVRLNTEFNHSTNTLGRLFGFAYGHKENGAMFSHMAMMYAYALFSRKFYNHANQLLEELFEHCQNFPVSRMYPGIPEYLDPQGRGMYPYLTGAASWYMLTLVTQMFGVRGINGDLLINPALNTTWFDKNGRASIQLPYCGRSLRIVVHNPSQLKPGDFTVHSVKHNGKELSSSPFQGGLLIERKYILELSDQGWQQLDVYLKNT
jgi:cellobiose phosphorylase